MRSWAASAAIAAGIATTLALPVIGQEAPKSTLPEGFDDAPPPVVTPPAPLPGAEPAPSEAPATTPDAGGGEIIPVVLE